MKISTPLYVLRHEDKPLRPVISEAAGTLFSNSIFGFSNKPFYDTFTSECDLALMPYPLVKGFLKNQIEASQAALNAKDAEPFQDGSYSQNLVIVDAAGPAAEVVYAVTMSSILEAFESKSKQLLASHLFRFDTKSSSYQMEEIAAE